MQTPVLAGFIISNPRKYEWECCVRTASHITEEAPFSQVNSSSSSRVRTPPSAVLVLVLRAHVAARKHVISETTNPERGEELYQYIMDDTIRRNPALRQMRGHKLISVKFTVFYSPEIQHGSRTLTRLKSRKSVDKTFIDRGFFPAWMCFKCW